MNQRIKELAKQAGFAMEIDNDPNSPPGWWGAGHNPTFEKFAKLIIADLDKVLTDNFYGDPHEIPDFIEDVKKHFGVEE